jgi:hypothetical protein
MNASNYEICCATNYNSIVYRHMKQNLVVLLADLFNLFEIHPAQCVDYPEADVASGKFNVFLH